MKDIKSFPPIEHKDCTVLIVGTVPSKVSLEKEEYYGNPNNIFWDIMFRICNNSNPDYPISEDYTNKKGLLLNNSIALWDVINYCERNTNLDIDIRNEVLNDVKSFFVEHPYIEVVFFNGKLAEKLFEPFKQSIRQGIKYIPLESTSPSNRKNPFFKLKQWKDQIKPYIK